MWSDPDPCEKIHGMCRLLPAYLLLFAIVTSSIAACERSDSISDTNTKDDAPVVLHRGNGGDPETLDPASAEDDHAFRVLTDLYEGLVTIDASGNVGRLVVTVLLTRFYCGPTPSGQMVNKSRPITFWVASGERWRLKLLQLTGSCYTPSATQPRSHRVSYRFRHSEFVRRTRTHY